MTKYKLPIQKDNGGFGSFKPPEPRYQGVSIKSFYIPMRDGVKIAIEVVLPKNATGGRWSCGRLSSGSSHRIN